MEITKLTAWAKQLLDTSKRSNLINYRENATNITLLPLGSEHSPMVLQNSEKFEIIDANNEPGELSEFEKFKSKISQKATGNSPRKAVLGSKTRLDYHTAFRVLARETKSRLEETGVSATFAAFGFLKAGGDDKMPPAFYAPILFIPVKIEKSDSTSNAEIEFQTDDAVTNTALQIKVKNEYGINIPALNEEQSWEEYLRQVDRIAQEKGWKITYDLHINLFSFQKVAMYQDLMNNINEMIAHPIIRKLAGDYVSEAELSADLNPVETPKEPLIDVRTVIDADSSQLEAIVKARTGKSFVLQGPPGTGKSQTIANIIADQLSFGKRILFVSEKQAALNVVYGKLKSLGIEDSCLELHSNKTNKSSVIAELVRVFELPEINILDKSSFVISGKEKTLNKLNKYTAAIHSHSDFLTYTPYQLMGQVAQYKNCPSIDASIAALRTLQPEKAQEIAEMLQEYSVIASREQLDYTRHPWSKFTKSNASLAEQDEFISSLNLAASKLDALANKLASLNLAAPCNFKQATTLLTHLKNVTAASQINAKLWQIKHLQLFLETAGEISETRKLMQSIEADLLQDFNPAVLILDTEHILREITPAFDSPFSRFFNKKKYLSHLEPLSKLLLENEVLASHSTIIRQLQAVSRFQQIQNRFEELIEPLREILAPNISPYAINWDTAKSEVSDLIESLHSLGVKDSNTIFYNQMLHLKDSEIAALSTELGNDTDELKLSIDKVLDYYPLLHVEKWQQIDFFEIRERIQEKLDLLPSLPEWLRISKLIDKLNNQNATAFLNACINKKIEVEDFDKAFLKGYFTAQMQNALDAIPEIRDLSREQHEALITDFQKFEHEHFKLNQSVVRSYLSSARPHSGVDDSFQGQALIRESKKKRGQMPVRMLLSAMPQFIQALKPCILMSPLSVATYVPSDFKFDLVIFDEASQVFPHDAIGAVFRGKQVIVVGDSKQMPPTNFFSDVLDSDIQEGAGDVNDFESILDIFSASFPTSSLKWHYRSQSESLIAFSNYHFYNNGLITFPDTDINSRKSGVQYEYAAGVYDTKSQTNRVEADRVVELVIQHYTAENPSSLGVVCFNSKQQILIENLLFKQLKRKPSLVSKMYNAREPFFVKNLESVQGDERDKIIFNTVYGRNASGVLNHNFGPLNRKGGERRLNVAITRARQSVVMLSSMHYNDIDTSRTSSVGALLLREYLRYAELGVKSLNSQSEHSVEDTFDSPFEMDVCDFLRAHGYTVRTQVGTSGYRIDLAVVNKKTGDYLAAVECDGATYHSSKNARDRDRIRQSVLESMGWAVYRIWSTNWFQEPDLEKQKLLAFLQEREAATVSEQHLTNLTATPLEQHELKEKAPADLPDQRSYEEERYKVSNKSSRPYKSYYWFDHNPRTIEDVIEGILKLEAPILDRVLIEKLISLKSKLLPLAGKHNNHLVNRVKFFTHPNFALVNNTWVRKGAEIKLRQTDDSLRKFEDIPVEELAAGMLEIIQCSFEITKNEVFVNLLNYLSRKRQTQRVKERLEAAFELCQKEIVTDSNGKLKIKQ